MRNKIINIHIPKTAGTSFNHRLNDTLRLDGNVGRFRHLYDERPVPLDEKYEAFRDQMRDCLSLDDSTELTFFSGHYRYRDLAGIVEQENAQVHWITFLRDPVTRTLSDYFFSRSDRNSAVERFHQVYPSFDDWLKQVRETNKQAEYLKPTQDASVEDTIANLKERFSLVGLTESADDDFEAMMNGLGLRAASPSIHNQNPDRDYLHDAIKTYGDRVREAISDDIKIYEAFSGPDRKVWCVPDLPAVASRKGEKPDHEQERDTVTSDELQDEIEGLAPWHHKIKIKGDIYTGAGRGNDATGEQVSLLDPVPSLKMQLKHVLPNGFEGRTFLDCACNAGGYSFAAKDWGASKTMGFDVRQHWIDQAEFVRLNREAPSDNMVFKKADLLDMSFLEPRYDVTWFSGIFYHLPDPITTLQNVAERTEEILVLNTAVTPMAPGTEEKPSLDLKMEGTDQLMSGIYSLSWTPSGPQVLRQMLAWMGFPETRLVFWHKRTEMSGRKMFGRLSLVAARSQGRLDDMPDAEPIDVRAFEARPS